MKVKTRKTNYVHNEIKFEYWNINTSGVADDVVDQSQPMEVEEIGNDSEPLDEGDIEKQRESDDEGRGIEKKIDL